MSGLNNISFRAGKVYLYSDFDGTYFPANQSKLHREDIKTRMGEYSKRMNKFFTSADGDLEFHITTGRTFGEFETASNIIRKNKFELPLPQTFISKNGGDEFIKVGNDKDFYKNGNFPFQYSKVKKHDGKSKMFLSFPPDYGYCPERNQIYDSFMNDLKQDMNEKKVKYKIAWETAESRNSFRKTCIITTEFEGGMLTKLYDTKKAMKKAIQNNDLLVLAGDASNDFEMLNPLEYLDKEF